MAAPHMRVSLSSISSSSSSSGLRQSGQTLTAKVARPRALLQACWRSLSDLRAIRQGNANGNKAGSESDTLAKLRGWAADRLGQSRTTVAEDAQLLKGDDADTARPSNARLAAAIAYRMEQKKLLMCCDRVFSILQSAGGCISGEE